MAERQVLSEKPCGCRTFYWDGGAPWEICPAHAKQLEDLRVHFEQPVLPMFAFCDTIETWFKAIERNNRDPELGAPTEADRIEELARTLHRTKSDKTWRVSDRWDLLPEETRARFRERAEKLWRAGVRPRNYFGRQGENYWEHLHQIRIDIRKSNLLGRIFHGGQRLRTRPCPQHKGHWSGPAMLEGCAHNCHGTGWLPEDPGDVTYTGGILLVRAVRRDDGGLRVTEIAGPPDQARKVDDA